MPGNGLPGARPWVQRKGSCAPCGRGRVGSAASAWAPASPAAVAELGGERGWCSGARSGSSCPFTSVLSQTQYVPFFSSSCHWRTVVCRTETLLWGRDFADPAQLWLRGRRSSSAAVQCTSFPHCSAPFTALGVIRLFCICQLDDYELTFHLKNKFY